MKRLEILETDAVLLRKRTLIEKVIGVLKTQTQLEHSRQRSFENFQVSVVSALIAYQLSENKPTLKRRRAAANRRGTYVPQQLNFFQTRVNIVKFKKKLTDF